jgi:glycosyltransferase 2 family protein
MPNLNSLRTRWFKWIVRLAILALVIYFVQGSLVKGCKEIGQQHWQLDFAWLALSGVLYLVSLLPAGWFWQRVLRAMNQDPRFGETQRAYFVGHLGKYVPGKALVVIIRATLIGSPRVDPIVAGASVFVETLTMMAVGACLSAAIIPFWFGFHAWLIALSLGLALAAGVPTIPPVFRRLLRLTPFVRKDPARLGDLHGINWATLSLGWCAATIGWLVSGLSLWACLKSTGTPNLEPVAQLPLYTAAVALGTVAGFLSLIPGGIVVREAVLMEILARHFGPSSALVAAVLLRLVWLVAELGISGILYVAGPRPSAIAATPGANPQGEAP